jgi:HEPN domain-containing protein
MSTEPDLPGDLLALAREDLASAEALHRSELVSDSPVGFHAQQAVEKALKAAMASRGLEFPFTHDLGVLMALCEDADLDLPDGLSEADRQCRHSYVTHLRAAGINDADLAEIVGHRVETVLARYAHSTGAASLPFGMPLGRTLPLTVRARIREELRRRSTLRYSR